MDVAVVKLGVGNTASVMFALERAGAHAALTDDPAIIGEAARLILPGVGAARFAMEAIERKGLAPVLRSFTRPLLGVCLGQQLFFERSEEGDAAGLALMPGVVRALPASAAQPSPHMGWSAIDHDGAHPLLEGVKPGAFVYFVHSYVCPIGAETIARAHYGRPFAAMVARGNAMGCQFHPERSGAAGARILANFLRTPC